MSPLPPSGKPVEACAAGEPPAEWMFRLYISGQNHESVRAFANIKKICGDYVKEKFNIKVVDLSVNPGTANDRQIVATPIQMRHRPLPETGIIGDLSDTERTLDELDLRTFVPAQPFSGLP